MVWTKEEQREYMKQYYKVNKAKIKEQQKQWYKDTIEQRMQYNIENREKRMQYNIENHDKKTILRWKTSGLIHPDYISLYNHYINTHQCDICNYKFDKNNCRCMDHDHSNGLFRQILCNNCNRNDRWIKVFKKNTYENYLIKLNNSYI